MAMRNTTVSTCQSAAKEYPEEATLGERTSGAMYGRVPAIVYATLPARVEQTYIQ